MGARTRRCIWRMSRAVSGWWTSGSVIQWRRVPSVMTTAARRATTARSFTLLRPPELDEPRQPYNPALVAMMLLAVLVLAGVAVILLVAAHCLVLDPADAQCRSGWGEKIRDMILELAPILIALIVVRR